MIQRQLDSQAELSPSIDRGTQPSNHGDYTTLRSKLVTEKSLQEKLDEITFSQDLLKEDVYQELKDILETTYAYLLKEDVYLECNNTTLAIFNIGCMQVRLLEKD